MNLTEVGTMSGNNGTLCKYLYYLSCFRTVARARLLLAMFADFAA